MGNGYAYVGDGPYDRSDPTGLNHGDYEAGYMPQCSGVNVVKPGPSGEVRDLSADRGKC